MSVQELREYIEQNRTHCSDLMRRESGSETNKISSSLPLCQVLTITHHTREPRTRADHKHRQLTVISPELKKEAKRGRLTKNSTSVSPSKLTAFEKVEAVRSRTSDGVAETAAAESASREREAENFMAQGREMAVWDKVWTRFRELARKRSRSDFSS